MPALLDKIKDVLYPGPCLAGFATVTPEGKPWVRYVMIQADEALTLRFATFLESRKVGQIRANPEVHITCGVTEPAPTNRYLQVQARAEVSTDEGERQAFWNEHLKTYFTGPDDPKYAVVICRPYRIEYMAPGAMEPEVWEA